MLIKPIKHPVQVNDVRMWAQDISFVLDVLESNNASKRILDGRLKLENVGVIGYSKGGAAAGLACLSDKRCKAGVNLSGFMLGEIAERPLEVPFMVMEAIESWCEDCSPINDLLFHSSKSSIYMVQIRGLTHGNFTDLSALGDYLLENSKGILGPICGRKFLEIQNNYVLQFFDQHLRGLPAPLLDTKYTSYPEVKFKARNME